MSRIYIDVANSRQGREWYTAIALIVRSFGTTILLWRNRMRDRRALARMSERELADIDLCRPQIAGGLDKPFWWGVSVATPKGVFHVQPRIPET